MRKVFVALNQCKPGMEVAETLYNDLGAVIIQEDTILDPHLIRKLYNLGIERIKIYKQAPEVIFTKQTGNFQEQHNENIKAIKSTLHDISSGKSLDYEKVNEVSESIFDKINENRDIVGCLNQIQSVDDYTYTHSVNVSLICMLIGKWMKFGPVMIKDILQAGLLHDIGKSKVPSEIIKKPGALSSEEFAEIKKHPIYSYRILENVPGISKDICMGVLMHHEREDGSGYPVGAKSEQIHPFAKIIAVADIYDAMTSERTYKEKQAPFKVFELMERHSFGVLDINVMNAFLSNIAAYYIGDFVRLSNGVIGEIIYINPRQVSRPLIRTGKEYIDLTQYSELSILELI